MQHLLCFEQWLHWQIESESSDCQTDWQQLIRLLLLEWLLSVQPIQLL
jgi:hypothetical protein